MNTQSVFAAFDLVPSLLSIAGIEAKEAAFDGENIAPALLGQKEVSREKPIFWRRPPDRKTAGPNLPERLPDLAMRESYWKLLCDYDGSKPQLYDLSKDRSETTNIADQHPEVVSRMREPVMSWHQSLPPDNGPALGAETPKKKR